MLHDSDDDLICATGQGDKNAFNELMRRHRRWVFSLIRTYVDHREQAEDLTQEVFYRVCHALNQYQGGDRFAGWLKQIAVNLARDHIRKQQRNPFVDAEDDLEENRPHPDEPPFDPMAILNSHMLHHDLRTAIQMLPDDQRLTLIMHYFGSMKLQDIAWAMQCPVGTVKSRLFNGLRRVRRILTTRWSEDEEGDLT